MHSLVAADMAVYLQTLHLRCITVFICGALPVFTDVLLMYNHPFELFKRLNYCV